MCDVHRVFDVVCAEDAGVRSRAQGRDPVSVRFRSTPALLKLASTVPRRLPSSTARGLRPRALAFPPKPASASLSTRKRKRGQVFVVYCIVIANASCQTATPLNSQAKRSQIIVVWILRCRNDDFARRHFPPLELILHPPREDGLQLRPPWLLVGLARALDQLFHCVPKPRAPASPVLLAAPRIPMLCKTVPLVQLLWRQAGPQASHAIEHVSVSYTHLTLPTNREV